jgi:hypothetical protein
MVAALLAAVSSLAAGEVEVLSLAAAAVEVL